jgi:hypothetical protein
MRDTAATDAMYVVAWPNLDSWRHFTDGRRPALASLDREAVTAELSAQASALAQDRVRVRVVHLAIDYHRPT